MRLGVAVLLVTLRVTGRFVRALGMICPGAFDTDAQLARHAGVAPLEASSGTHRRHRLVRGGIRQLNCALHRIAITQARDDPPARASLDRKRARAA